MREQHASTVARRNHRTDEATVPFDEKAHEAAPAATASGASEVRASPIARKLASENGIDLRDLSIVN